MLSHFSYLKFSSYTDMNYILSVHFPPLLLKGVWGSSDADIKLLNVQLRQILTQVFKASMDSCTSEGFLLLNTNTEKKIRKQIMKMTLSSS